MTQFKSISIRSSLIGLIAVMAVIPFCFMIYSLVSEKNRQIADVVHESATHAEQTARLISQVTESSELLLNMLCRLPIVQAGEEKTVNKLLLDMVSEYPQFSSIFIVDRSGQRWATTNVLSGSVSYSDRKYFANALSSGKFSSGEYAIGKVKKKPVFSFGLPIRNSSGEITGVAVATIELSGLKNLVLKSNIEDYKTIIVMDYKGKILIHSNRPELEGTQEHESVFQHLLERPENAAIEAERGDDTSKKIISHKRLTLPNEKSPYMYVLVEADKNLLLQGPNRIFNSNLAVLLTSMLLSLVIAYRISKRFMVDKVDESEQRHRALFETSPQGIIYQNAEGLTVSANPVAEKLFPDLQGKMDAAISSPEYPKFIHEDGTLYPPETHPAMEALSSGAAVQNRIMGVLRSSEDICTWIRITSIPMFRNNETKPHMAYSMLEDISWQLEQERERKNIEQQMLHARKLESLGIMAGGIAHDFNNLLQSIQGNLEMASRYLDSDSKSKVFIANSMISCKHAAHLTNLMLTYTGSGVIAKKRFNLNELVIENMDILKTTALTTVSTELCLSSELPVLMADEAGIQQVVMNLIINAAEAIEENQPGCIKLATGIQNFEQTYLSKSLLEKKPESGRFVFLEVSDNGCGMTQETLNRLLDPFFTTKFTGRGLGMSAVMGIIKAHGGALFVESQPGKGTTVRILLPAPENELSASAQEVAPTPSMKSDLSEKTPSGLALLVDDEKSVLNVCAKMLQLCGFKVITARDGDEAVLKFREQAEEITVVLMDLTMPNMGGIAAMEEIYGIRPDTKVILASGFNEEELSKRFHDQAPSGFIRKPYSFMELKEILESVLSTPDETPDGLA